MCVCDLCVSTSRCMPHRAKQTTTSCLITCLPSYLREGVLLYITPYTRVVELLTDINVFPWLCRSSHLKILGLQIDVTISEK